MGRAKLCRALTTGITADEFLLLKEAVDERRGHEDVGVGTLAEASLLLRQEFTFLPDTVLGHYRKLATVSNYQNRILLRDTVWVDETYINDTDLSKGYGQVRKRGLSLQKLSICAPSMSKRTPSRSFAATGSPARLG